MRTRGVLILLALVVTVNSPAGAQGSPPPVGARIRITSPGVRDSERVGTVVSVTSDSIRFTPDSRPASLAVAHSDIKSIEVSAGRVSARNRFALIGVAIGGAVGFASGYHESGGNGGQYIGGGKKSAMENALLSAAIVGVLGGVTGWIVGGSHTQEKWVPAARR